jgi:uncharacterized protein (DUF58 family)
MAVTSSNPGFHKQGWDRQAWWRFLLALLGLALAFLAAVFSTVFSQAGQVIPTAIMASLALFLAGAVGVTSIPYLARRVALPHVRDALDYDVTREGLAYLALVLVIGVAALNTGNNLLFIVVSAMLAAILVSGAASAWTLRGIAIEAVLPHHVFARRPVPAKLILRNTRRLSPAFSITLAPPASRADRGWIHPEKFRGFRISHIFRRPNKSTLPAMVAGVYEAAGPEAHGIFQRTEYFPLLPARGSVNREVELLFPRRGRYTQRQFDVSTRFPFSFLRKTRHAGFSERSLHDTFSGLEDASTAREVLVYPEVEPSGDFIDLLPVIMGEFEAYLRGRGHDLYRIREYLPQDSSRHVDWKATARTGLLKVREFTREDERKLRIVFDNPSAGVLSSAAYERGVAMAASLAWHFAGGPAEISFAATGSFQSTDVHDFLKHLALIEPESGLDAAPLPESPGMNGGYDIVVSGRTRESIPAALWERSYWYFLGELPDLKALA